MTDTPATPRPLPTLEEYAASTLAGRLDLLADRLESAAAHARRHADHLRGGIGTDRTTHPYAFAASSVLGEVVSALANANLGGVLTSAAEVEVFRAEAKADAKADDRG